MSKMFIDTPNLIFQSHETQTDASLKIPDSDISVLRELGKKYAQIASLPIQAQRKEMWKKLNDLQKVKPMIWMSEVCWNEMDVNDELKLRTTNEVCQRIETELRRTIYQWEHMQGDMIVEEVIYSPYIIHNTGFGINPIADVAETDHNSQIASRSFHNQITSEDDIEKIKIPKITHDANRTEKFYQAYKNIFDGILRVEKRSCAGFWFAPWDDIVMWMGAEEVLLNLVLKPDLMHKIIDRVVTVYLAALDQFEEQNLLALNLGNLRIGSGAYGYTSELPQKVFSKDHIRSANIWGAATAQIFGSVSPQMHKEFGVDYEIRWLKRFGMNYYGCCEPLHNKIKMLKSILNLRKISISPWAKLDVAATEIGRDYVISLKPSPTVLASQTWNPDLVREELKTKLEITKRCNVEMVIKDISTVNHQPQRLWEWTKIASEIAERYK